MVPDSARQLLDLDLEGIREAPMGLVVCCDRRALAAGVLGRATFVDADVWSCACAIQNLWLAARAEGLGVGWVTLFEPADLAALVGAPEGVTTLGWLCLGWPDERPPSPGLERRGWSARVALEDLIVRETWPADGATPTPPPSRLTVPPAAAVVAAHDLADGVLTAPGSLGVLDRAVDKLVAVGAGTAAGCLIIAASDHRVTAYGVSAFPTEVTRHVTEAAVAGSSVGAVAARVAGLEVMVVDAGVEGEPVAGAQVVRPHGPRGDLVTTDGLTADATELLVATGAALAPASGLVAVGEVGVGNTTVAAALAAALLDADPARLVGLGSGSDSRTVDAKRRAVTAAVDRFRSRGSASDPLEALAALGGGEIALLVGVILGASARQALVVLDGMATSVAALVAVELEPAVAAHLVAGQRSRETGHQPVLAALGLEPLLDLRLRAGEGVGAALAGAMLRSGARIRVEAARVAEGAS